MKDTAEFFGAMLMLIGVFSIGLTIGNIIGNKEFVDNNYGKEFIVIEKTIKADEFSYKISDGKRTFDLTTTDNLEIKDVITIGVK